MKKQQKQIFIIISLIVVGLLLFNHYKPFATTLRIDTTSTAISTDNIQYLEFKHSWSPYQNSELPVTNGNQCLLDEDISITPSSSNAPRISTDLAYILDKDYPIKYAIVGGNEVKDINGYCHLSGERHTDTSTDPYTNYYGVFLTCNLKGYIDCSITNQVLNAYVVDSTGYLLVQVPKEGFCVEGIESCEGNISQICQNGVKVDVGIIPGKCNVPTECTSAQTQSCVKTFTVTSCQGIQTCSTTGVWGECAVSEDCGKKATNYLYYIIGGGFILLIGLFFLLRKKKHGRR